MSSALTPLAIATKVASQWGMTLAPETVLHLPSTSKGCISDPALDPPPKRSNAWTSVFRTVKESETKEEAMPVDTTPENQQAAQAETGMTRRRVLLGAGALASAAVARSAFAGPNTGSPVGEHRLGHRYLKSHANKQHKALTAAANDCVDKGQACISHCMETFLDGDTTMAECAASVQQMLPVCTAMAYLSSYDSKHLPALAKACIGICEDCEKECRVHEEHQPECRACADACAALITEAKKLLV